MPKLPAIVSSAGSPAAVTIVQTLGAAGIPIHALSNMEHAACFYSRYTSSAHLTPLGVGGQRSHDNVHEPEELLDYLVERVERGVLFPGSDGNIRFLAHHKEELLRQGFRLCIPDERVLAIAANKSDLATFCAANGFPVPATVVVDSARDLERVRDELRFPVILKGVFVKNHRFVETPDDLRRCYAAFLDRARGITLDAQAVAQEWVPGRDDRFVKLYVICDERSRVIAHHTLRRLRVHTRRDGSQGDTLIARTERVEPMIERWLPFFQAIRWIGVASMECKYDERDDRYKLIEINPRPWAILKISVACGVNVPLLYYRLAQGERLEPRTDFAEGGYYIRLLWGNRDFPEPAVALGMLWNRRITLREVLRVYGELLRHLDRVTVDVGCLHDPVPTLACMYYYGVRRFRDWF
jgi:predicted ATP-grasp superfamily ATP-dependent carboligase